MCSYSQGIKFSGQDIGREYAYNLSFPIKTSLGVGVQDPSFELHFRKRVWQHQCINCFLRVAFKGVFTKNSEACLRGNGLFPKVVKHKGPFRLTGYFGIIFLKL